jgi:hypothetical protein
MEATINKPLTIYGKCLRAVEASEDTPAYHDFVLSTESVDRHGTVFRAEGWELENYNNTNPVVTYAHYDNDANLDMVIGTSKTFIEDGKLIGRVFYEPAEINPLAEKVRKKAEHGTLRMASISALPKEGHFGDESKGEKRDVLYFDKQELLAWSIVPVGSNRDALKRNTQAVEDIKKRFTEKIEVQDPKELKNKPLSIREAQFIINKNVQ